MDDPVSIEGRTGLQINNKFAGVDVNKSAKTACAKNTAGLNRP
jgi:hypothetical protein